MTQPNRWPTPVVAAYDDLRSALERARAEELRACSGGDRLAKARRELVPERDEETELARWWRETKERAG